MHLKSTTNVGTNIAGAPTYPLNFQGDIMGEWISSNVLLPLMYLLIDMGIAFGVLILAMHLLEKLISSKIFKNIRR